MLIVFALILGVGTCAMYAKRFLSFAKTYRREREECERNGDTLGGRLLLYKMMTYCTATLLVVLLIALYIMVFSGVRSRIVLFNWMEGAAVFVPLIALTVIITIEAAIIYKDRL